ncbi:MULTISPECIES: LysR family transcriptional regulator [unclassified Streptomyces]|uniref:LysR family transcriptional regulator n=1 Tax=unclassified Streptomyces TaxID=2593676 RepID=UPI001908C89B|nr:MULTISPECIES: LysR family transcriptional regulator [unclassified Streptomyces]MCU4748895.1 LysR family transcriptional regulator [Streptomyces sp. G-5]QQN80336.1 LysR family transcriptional regulator [Streptomyces sp. XC 2026]
MAQPTLMQLSYFLAAVSHGSFSAAADALHIAQPSLSEQIRRLEHTLGVVLFTRTNRRLQLTDAGRTLLPHAERTLADVRELGQAVREVRTLSGGTVSFGAFNSAHLYLLTPLIRDFHEQYPQVLVRVVGLNSAEVADAVRAGELEAGLVQLPIKDHGLSVGAPVLTDTVVYVSADPERARTPVGIEALAAAPLVLSEARWEDEDPLRRALTERAQRAGVTLRPYAEVEFQTHAVELAAHGVGDSLVSYLVARSQGYTRRLHWAQLDPPVEEHFAFITRSGGALSPATRMFMKIAHKHIAALQRRAKRGLAQG